MNLPSQVGVYGGGRMGSGIAHAFLAAGSSVTVIEADDTAAAAARDRITASIAKASARGTLSADAAAVETRLVVASTPAALEGCALVIEAVPEIVELKAHVLTRIEMVVPEAVLASNTSSLSINGLAAHLIWPKRFLGLHFFNPVPVSELVEIVVGDATDATLVAAACGWVAALGKTPITVSDRPGFASSRLGVAIALEAMRMLEDGVASADDIDRAMTLGYKHPTGPLRTTDIVGLDVRLAIAEHLERELGARFAPPEILRRKVADGNLGRKTGRGFFSW